MAWLWLRVDQRSWKRGAHQDCWRQWKRWRTWIGRVYRNYCRLFVSLAGRKGERRDNLTSSVESIASSNPFGVVIIVEWKPEEGKFSSDTKGSKTRGKQPARA